MNELAVVEQQRGVTSRQDFGGREVQRSSETASTSLAARQQAVVQARCLMAERHPRNWDTVRVRVLSHCERPRFAEVARYSKPAGKAFINGVWVEQRAEGLSARFAEVARQEMGNMETFSYVVYEDDLIRNISAGVSDIERNTHESREFAIAKAVEKKGKKDRQGNWSAPEGRELVAPNPRLNSYGDPVWLVKATDDEVRSKQNSEISKTQRDATLRLMPKDIRDEAEEKVIETLKDPKKTDPQAAKKRVIDSFATLNVMPDDLVNYLGGVNVSQASPKQLDELRGLFMAIRDGEATFQDALAEKFGKNDEEAGSREAQTEVQERKIAEANAKQAEREKKTEMPAPADEVKSDDAPLSKEDQQALDAQAQREETATKSFGFGGKK